MRAHCFARTGLSLCSSPPDPHILLFGLGVGSVARFLSFHLPPMSTVARMTVVEPSRAAAAAFFATVSEGRALPSTCVVVDENLQAYHGGDSLLLVDCDVVLVDCGAVPSEIFERGFGPAGELLRALIGGLKYSPKLVAAAVCARDGERLRAENKSFRTFREHQLRLEDDDDEAPELVVVVDSSAATLVSILTETSKAALNLTVSSWHAASGSVYPGAMDVAAAQKTLLVRSPSLLSASDISAIMAAGPRAVELGAGIEVRSGAVPGDPWSVIHMNTKGIFDAVLPGMRARLLAAARDADEKEGWNLLPPADEDVRIRVAELHAYKGPTTGLPDPHHYDQDSLITVDCMLSKPDVEFEGGVLRTLEPDGRMLPHEFDQGDCVAFVSHKYHSVTPVVKGVRNVLVVEFWRGQERRCGHRCLLFKGRCPLEGDEGNKGEDTVKEADAANELEIPFRLGSIAETAKGERLLLWEPATTAQQLVEQQQQQRIFNAGGGGARRAVPLVKLAENDEAWKLFD